MKLNKKIVLVSAVALMALSPAVALTQNNEPVFAASKKAVKNMASHFITVRVIFILAS